MAHGSAVAWRHLNLLGENDFSEEKLRVASESGSQNWPSKQALKLGAAEPPYVPESTEVAENSVGLYVPLLESNQQGHHNVHAGASKRAYLVLKPVAGPRVRHDAYSAGSLVRNPIDFYFHC